MSRPGQVVLLLLSVAVLAGCGGTGDSAVLTSPSPAPSESAEMVELPTVVPDVTGLSGAEAAAQLSDAGMTASFISMSDGGDVAAADAATSPVIRTYPEAGDEVTSSRSVSVFVGADLQASPTPAPSPAVPTWDLTTDAGLCAADAELTNLELNDAIAQLLGFPADRDDRSIDQDDAIRAYKNEAFARACPERAS